MGSKRNVEIIQEAINQLLEEEEIKSSSTENLVTVDVEENEKSGVRRHRHQRRLLSQLLSQLESLEEDNNNPEESKQEANVEETLPSPSEIDGNINNTRSNCENEEIIKELKNLKRQNLITHCLLSAMIVVTLAWQLSEVSLILTMKHVLSNPFKSLGGIMRRLLKGQSKVNVQDLMKQASAKQKQVFEPASLPGIKIPELPQLDLPGLETNDDD